jgi:hypothetical protein
MVSLYGAKERFVFDFGAFDSSGASKLSLLKRCIHAGMGYRRQGRRR